MRLIIISYKLVAVFFTAFVNVSSQLLNKIIVLKHVFDLSHELRVGFACVVFDLLPHLRQLELAEDKLRVACFEGVFKDVGQDLFGSIGVIVEQDRV